MALSTPKIFVAFCCFITLFASSLAQIVQIEDGIVQGTTMQSRKGANFFAFLKIPYAKPPVGDLRFQPPVRNEGWQGVLNATAHGPTCVQHLQIGNFAQSEDCLHVYVYTKDLNPSVRKPVIVYIHGGAFEIGSGVEQQPDYLMDRDIVVVTFNYRLGALGFLALGIREVAGNMGLKDQAYAIQWVNRNIARFGGDPNKVILAGMSVGAVSVTSHMISDMSRNLFHGAIAMSGSITEQKNLIRAHPLRAGDMARTLNCPTEVNAMYACLRTKDAAEINRAARFDFYNCTLLFSIPVLEPEFGQERFFTAEPNDLFRSGNFSRIPIMIGITADEFIQPAAEMLENEAALDLLNNNFTDFTARCMWYDANGIQTREQMSKALRSLYFPFDKIDSRSFSGLNQFIADSTIGFTVHRLVHFTSKLTDVFYYKFSFIGRFSLFNFPRNQPFGVHHGDDLQYVLHADFLGPKISQTDPENFMVERMTRMWEQFAWHGDPNNSTDEYLSEIKWLKHSAETEYYLDIGLHAVEKQGLYLQRFSVWDNFENEISAGRASRVALLAVLFAFMSHFAL